MIKDPLFDAIKDYGFEISEFGPPEESGIYMVLYGEAYLGFLTGPLMIAYIGSSKNIKKRVLNPNHPYRVLYNLKHKTHLVFTASKVMKEGYRELEWKLISEFMPDMNKVGKGYILR